MKIGNATYVGARTVNKLYASVLSGKAAARASMKKTPVHDGVDG